MAVLAVVLGASSGLSAQTVSGSSSRPVVGVEGGLALATLSSYDAPDPDAAFDTALSRSGTVGVFLWWPLTGLLSVRPEVVFVPKGATLRSVDAGSPEVAVVRLRYVELPVLLQVGADTGRLRPFANVGPAFAFKLSASVDASASGGGSDIDVGSQVRSVDAAIAAGGGLAARRWSAEVRFVQGVIDIGNTRRVGDVIRTRTLSALGAIRF